MYGVTFAACVDGYPCDFRHSKSTVRSGEGRTTRLQLSRSFHDNFRWEVLAGSQSFASVASQKHSARFLTGNFEANMGSTTSSKAASHATAGGLQNYDQWTFTFGYRFDTAIREGNRRGSSVACSLNFHAPNGITIRDTS